jgi:hypothetical protein
MSVFPHAARKGGLAAAALAALAIALSSIPALAQNGTSQSPAKAARPTVTRTPDWDRFSAEITLKRTHVDANGKPKGEFSPDVTYRWERTSNGNGWKTRITLVRQSQPLVHSVTATRPLEVPIAVSRMEDDEDGTPIRFFGSDGREIRIPTPEELAKLVPDVAAKRPTPPTAALLHPAPTPRPGTAGRDWADSILVPKSKRDSRRQSFEREFGPPAERVRTLDRYVGTVGGARREVLVDPESAVPVEVNVAADGVLVSHTTFDYEPQADGSLLRLKTRTEQRLSSSSDERLVSEIELKNVRFERGGAR